MDSTVIQYCPILMEEGNFFSNSLDISGCHGYVLWQNRFHFTEFSSFYKSGETDFADILVL